MRNFRPILAIASLIASMVPTTHAALLGPLGGSGLTSEYAQFSDSPFSGLSLEYFHLEDFEDHLFNVPGVSGSPGGVTSVVFGPSIHDSVDLDDGVLDGSGLNGDDYFAASGSGGIRFTFDAVVLGALPTHAGIVWTDGAGTTSFEAFDHNGISLGTIGPVTIADAVVNGTTTDDRFFGVIEFGGISAIEISNTIGGIEVDHLQYGNLIPIPTGIWLLGSGLAALAATRRRPAEPLAQIPAYTGS